MQIHVIEVGIVGIDKAGPVRHGLRHILENARQQLSWWEPIEFDRKAILDLYFTGNPSARGLVNAPQRVAEILRDARAVIASGGRV